MVPFVSHFGEQKHTGVNLLLMMESFFRLLGIDDYEIAKVVVLDNASNNKLMIKLSDNMIGYHCKVHTMQLCVNDSFKSTIQSVQIDMVIKKFH